MPRASFRAVINRRVLLTLTIAAVALGGALVGAHYIRKRMIADQALADGRAAIQKADWSEAAKQLRRYLGKYPDDAAILRDYGQASLRIHPRTADHLAAAASAYRRLLRIETQDLDAFARLTEINARLGDAANVAQTADRWAAAAADEVAPQLWLARSTIARRDFESAEKQLSDLVNKHPRCVDAYALLAALAASAGHKAADPAESLRWLNQAVENSGTAEAHLQRAQFLSRSSAGLNSTGREDARSDLAEAERGGSTNAFTWLGIAAEWHALGDVERARAALERASRAWNERKPSDFDDPDEWLAALTIQQCALAMQAPDFVGGAETAGAALEQLTQPGHRARVLPDAIRLDIAVREFDRARHRLEEFASLQSSQPGPIADTVSLLRAALASAEGRPYATIDELESLVVRNPSVPQVWQLLGDAYRQTDQPRRAARALRECVRLSPGQIEPLLALLRLQVRLQDWGAALSTVGLAEPLAQEQSDFRILRLQARAGAIEPGPAVERLIAETVALQRENPSRPETYAILAHLHALSNRGQRAEEELGRAVAASSDSLSAEMQLVRLHASANRLDQAEQAARTLCERHPASASVAILLSDVQRAAGKLDAAIHALQDAEKRMTDPAARREVILHLAATDTTSDPAIRKARLDDLITADPDDVRAYALLLELPEVWKDPASSQKSIDEIKRIEGNAGTTWRLQQARLWLDRVDWNGQQKDIEALLTRCIEIEPGWADPVLVLGGMYERGGAWEKAEELYQRALGLNAAATQVASRLVGVLEKQGKLDKARSALEEYARGTSSLDEQRLRVAVHSGDVGQAIQQLQERLQQNPADAQSRAMLASFTYHRTRDADAALKVLGNALQPDTPSLACAGVRTAILRSAGRADEAGAFLDELVSKRDDFAARLLRADHRRSTGDLPGAEADLRDGIELGSRGEGHFAFALFCSSQGRLGDATTAIDQGLQKFPDNEGLKRLQIRVLLDRKQDNDWPRADALLRELEQRHADDLELMWIRARIKLAKDEPDAEALLQRIVTLEPRSLDAHLGLSALSLKRRDFREARQKIARATSVIPDNPKLGLFQAQIELAARNPSATMDVLRGVLRAHPQDDDARRMFLGTAVLTRAPALLTEALRLADGWSSEPSASASLQISRAFVLNALERPGDAVSSLESVLDQATGDARRAVLLALAELHRTNRQFELAQKCLDQVAPSSLRDPALLREQWLLFAQQQRLDDLASAVEDCSSDEAPNIDLLFLGASILGNAPAHAGRATAIFERVMKLAPNRTDIQVEYGLLLLGRGDRAEAKNQYRKVLAVDPQNAAALNNLAWILSEEQNEYSRALELAHRAVDLMPSNPSFLDTRGVIHEKLGSIALARADFEECVALTEAHPAGNAAARLKLARFLINTKRDAARVQVDKVFEIDGETGVLNADQRNELQELERLCGKVE